MGLCVVGHVGRATGMEVVLLAPTHEVQGFFSTSFPLAAGAGTPVSFAQPCGIWVICIYVYFFLNALLLLSE